MKLWLDDLRPAPKGWMWTKTPEDTIQQLQIGGVTNLSLDHDLGDTISGNGYDVLLWIERETCINKFRPPQFISVHSDNSSARVKMELAISSIQKFHELNQGL